MVDRCELLAGLCLANDDPVAAQLVEVECMERLPALHHDVVGDVDDVVDRLVSRETVWSRSIIQVGDGPTFTPRTTRAMYCGHISGHCNSTEVMESVRSAIGSTIAPGRVNGASSSTLSSRAIPMCPSRRHKGDEGDGKGDGSACFGSRNKQRVLDRKSVV